MTKDNWIKAFRKKFWGLDGSVDVGGGMAMSGGNISSYIEDFISQVEKDAIEKTNKRWVERLAKFSRMGEISEKEVLQDFIKNKSDLLEDKKE